MNYFIVATHSFLARGFEQAISFFFPDFKNISFINAYTTEKTFEDELSECLANNREKNIVVLTDITGGSVTQSSLVRLQNDDFILISGLNLALLFILIIMQEEIGLVQARNAIEQAKEDMKLLNDLLERGEESNDSTFED